MAVVRILPASTIFATWRGYVDQALLFIVAKRGGSLVLSNRISVETMCRFFSNDRPLGRSLRFAPLNRIPGFVVSTKVSHNTVQDLLQTPFEEVIRMGKNRDRMMVAGAPIEQGA